MACFIWTQNINEQFLIRAMKYSDVEDAVKKVTPNLRKVSGQEKQQSCKGSERKMSLVCERNWKEARAPEAWRAKEKMEGDKAGQPGRGKARQSLWTTGKESRFSRGYKAPGDLPPQYTPDPQHLIPTATPPPSPPNTHTHISPAI